MAKNWRDKGETGTKISWNPSFSHNQIYNSANAVHQQRSRRVDLKQKRNQDSCAKHGEQVLQAQWKGLPSGNFSWT
jgi:hypothetical protein